MTHPQFWVYEQTEEYHIHCYDDISEKCNLLLSDRNSTRCQEKMKLVAPNLVPEMTKAETYGVEYAWFYRYLLSSKNNSCARLKLFC